MNQQKNTISLTHTLTKISFWKCSSAFAVWLVLLFSAGLISGCLSDTINHKIESVHPASDSVVIVYMGRRDSTLMLSLKIRNYDRFPGIAHSETTKSISSAKSCDNAVRGICAPSRLNGTYDGIVGVIYMSDEEIYQSFSQIYTWANDCGHVDVTAHFDDGLRFDLMFLEKFDSIVRSNRLDDSSFAIYERFLSNVRRQENISPLGCM